ncbi:hypothetical protein C8J57DRAFT_594139 [Mycena rebaudengoi]|nr:hypothetical protein C8J57DRAFT_594139 [Mycena rebaudengoi]
MLFLLQAQKQSFRAYPRPHADFSLIHDLQHTEDLDEEEYSAQPRPSADFSLIHDLIQDLDAEESSDEDYSSSDEEWTYDPMAVDSDSDGSIFADAGGCMDVDSYYEEYKAGDSDSDYDQQDFVQEEIPPYPTLVPKLTSSQRKRKRLESLLEDVSGLPELWCRHIQDFFYPTSGDIALTRHKDLVVQDLVDMRGLPSRAYSSNAFQSALETSGLAALLHRICRPGNLLETSHPDVELSFRFHDWKLSYAELYVRWTPATISLEEYEKTLPPSNPKYDIDVKVLFRFISDNPRMHPWTFNPMAVFLFLSVSCFEVNCDLWLVPSLTELKFPVSFPGYIF